MEGNETVFQRPTKYDIFGFDQNLSSRPLAKGTVTRETRL